MRLGGMDRDQQDAPIEFVRQRPRTKIYFVGMVQGLKPLGERMVCTIGNGIKAGVPGQPRVAGVRRVPVNDSRYPRRRRRWCLAQLRLGPHQPRAARPQHRKASPCNMGPIEKGVECVWVILGNPIMTGSSPKC